MTSGRENADSFRSKVNPGSSAAFVMDFLNSGRTLEGYDSTQTEIPLKWTDDHYTENYKPMGWKFERPSRDTRISVAKVFLDLYTKGATTSDSDVHAIYANLLWGMRSERKNEFVVDDEHAETQFAKIGVVSCKETLDDPVKQVDFYSKGVETSGVVTTKSVDLHTSVTVNAFIKEMLTALNYGRESDEEIKEHKLAILEDTLDAISYLALKSLATNFKEAAELERSIIATVQPRVQKFYPNFQYNNSIPPPHKNFQLLLRRAFAREGKALKGLLVTLISSYCDFNKTNEISRRGVLNEALFVTVKGTGFGLITWVTRAAQHLGIGLKDLVAYTEFSTFSLSIHRLVEFSDLYISCSTPQQTWPWARVLNSSMCNDYSTKKNLNYVTLMVAITVEGNKDDPIWKTANSLTGVSAANIDLYCAKAKILHSKLVAKHFDGWRTT